MIAFALGSTRKALKYKIEVTEDAELDLESFRVFDRRIITDGIRTQLSYEPLTETRNRKRLRENPLAPWELRIQKYRVFYRVEDEVVVVGAIGYKKHNSLFIRGRETKL